MHFAPTPPEDFEPWETAALKRLVARFLVARFYETRPIPASIERDDLLQEAFRHWSTARATYRAGAGAQRKTYLDRVVERYLISLERGWNAAKRTSGKPPLSLERPPPSADDEPSTPLSERLAGPEETNNVDLSIDIQKALNRLTPRQRRVMSGLAEGVNVTTLAKRIGVSRDTLYEDRRRIRQVCEDVGLREYLS